MPQQEGGEEYDSLRRRINECEKRNQTLIETNLYGIQVIDIHGTITYINSVQSGILGYDGGELAGEEIWALMATDEEGDALSQYLTRLARDEAEALAWTGTFLKKNHLPVQLEMNWNCMRNEQRYVTGFVSFTTAVHEDLKSPPRENGANGQNGASERFRNIIEGAREIIFTFDPQGNITYMNERGLERIGYFDEEIRRMSLSDLLPPEQIQRLQEEIFDAPSMSGGLYTIELINRDLDLVPLECMVSRIGNPLNRAKEILFMGRDLTRQKEAEQYQIREHRIDSAVRFASNVAADLRLLAHRLEREGSPLEDLDRLIRKLDGLSEEDTEELYLTPGDLRTAVRRSAQRIFAGTGVRVRFFLPNSLMPVSFDSEALRNALEILMENARDAMPGGGQVKVLLKNMEITADEADGPLVPGDYVRISIEDHGVGIPEEHLIEIFDPYFTTKSNTGEGGSGFGLATAHAIVRRHRGLIRVSSKPRIRTAFEIILPADRSAPAF